MSPAAIASVEVVLESILHEDEASLADAAAVRTHGDVEALKRQLAALRSIDTDGNNTRWRPNSPTEAAGRPGRHLFLRRGVTR
jgi:hypothetical protein